MEEVGEEAGEADGDAGEGRRLGLVGGGVCRLGEALDDEAVGVLAALGDEVGHGEEGEDAGRGGGEVGLGVLGGGEAEGGVALGHLGVGGPAEGGGAEGGGSGGKGGAEEGGAEAVEDAQVRGGVGDGAKEEGRVVVVEEEALEDAQLVRQLAAQLQAAAALDYVPYDGVPDWLACNVVLSKSI